MTQPSGGAPSAEAVLAAVHAAQQHDLPTAGGHTLAYVYDSGVAGLDELAVAAYASAMHANALDPTAFPSLAVMEGDLVATAASLLRGDDGTVGVVTSGGTESCLLAVAAARDARPDIATPRMVIASSAHAAFHKAAHYFGVTLDVVEVDPATLKADAAAMARAIGPDTVLVVASAPSYAHGVIDPIPEIAAAAASKSVRCHVDACIGGWILGSWRRFGIRDGDRAVPDFDFSVPGVTSISVDLHKYAYTPKGASVLLHATADLRAPQFFVETDWPGYAMLNTTMQSTRSGGPITAAWAVVARLGERGYRDIAERTAGAVDRIRDGVAAIDGLSLVAEPEATLLAVTATDGGPNVFVVADEMAARGYYIQPQFGFRGLPATLHMTITAANAGQEDDLVAALAESVAAARAVGDPELPQAALEAVMTADLSTAAGLAAVAAPLGLLGADGSLALPGRMAPLNALLNALDAEQREVVFRGVLTLLNRTGRSLL
jgi:glutamate/tyrosine decarboxylase-like PLP-dependent enzyme